MSSNRLECKWQYPPEKQLASVFEDIALWWCGDSMLCGLPQTARDDARKTCLWRTRPVPYRGGSGLLFHISIISVGIHREAGIDRSRDAHNCTIP